MKKRISIILSIVLCITLLTGCSGSKSEAARDSIYASVTTSAAAPGSAGMDYGYSDMSYGYSDNGAYYEEADYKAAYADTPADQEAFDNAQPVNLTGRKLIKSVDMSLETLTFDDTTARIESQVNLLGGYMQGSYLYNDNAYDPYRYSTSSQYYNRSNRYATYTVRIPSDKLDAFLNAVGNLGTVLNQTLNTKDVTLEYVDTESRAEALKIQLDRLLAILEKAETVEDVIALESRISDVTYQLERKESVLKNYDNLVEFSTVSLLVQEVQHYTIPEVVPETVGQRIAAGLKDTFYDISEGFKDFIVGLTVDLPYILIWGVIIAAVAFVTVKIVRKRRSKKAQKAAETSAAKEE